ncbi:MAG TPA: DUF4280 domain-containing protein [Chitinophaga sp.]|uniref:DUF4280 domain-containing protein n=1 Tax=Chitinophaga sp. TaxID=1869181 RepID=UPI002CB0234D|nr:DUF4280 domain-containing protein [Chitinophaga sp.]HVI46644.1 DUF4280 domain-containing protein [Chitinophaga sp.]
MADKHFVVQGAACSCQFGGSPDKLKVEANDREFINDSNGSTKLIASTKDTGQPFEAKTFGNCSITRGACSPAVTQWENPYQKVTLTNGGKVLTEESKAVCSVSGAPCIKIDFHGQEAAVSQAHFDKVEIESLSVLNPMAKPDTQKEQPKVKQIKVKLNQHVPPEVMSASKKEAHVPVIKVRVDESLKFEVAGYYNPGKADTARVGWKITGGRGPQVFEEAGPSLDINFDAPGNYRVMAFGNPDPDKQDDSRCAIDIQVVNNKLKEEFGIGADAGRMIPGVGGKFPKAEEYRVRRGVPVTINAKYDIDPATAEEKERVSMQVTDAAGNILAGPTEPGGDSITFTPANSAAVYKVTAIMIPQSPGEASQTVTKEMVSESNSVMKVTNDQNTHIVRPGTSMNFKVSQMRYSTMVQDFEAAQIKWQLNGVQVGTGTSLTLDGQQYLQSPGRYVVEAYVSQANAWDSKHKKPTAAAAKSEDDWVFDVKPNEIVSLRVKDGNNQWVVGKKYTLIADLLMPYDQADGPLTWTPAGGNGATHDNVFAPSKGKFVVSAKLGSSMKQLDINADYAQIVRWCFTDAEGIFKHKAGWHETVKAVITSPQAAGESVNLHILEFDSATKINYIKDAGMVTFDAQGEAKLDIKTDDLKTKLEALNWEGKYYDVFFGVLQKPDGMQFMDVKPVESNGMKCWFPKRDSNARDKETGKFLYISKEPEVVSVHFYDSTKAPAFKVYPYGEKIRIHIQTMNLAGEDVQFQLWENRYKLEDICVQDIKLKVKDDETLDVDLDTNKLKSGNAREDGGLRAFYVVLKNEKKKGEEKLVKFLYPEKTADANTFNPLDINFYHHIKLSAAFDSLNKAFGTVAPAVLGEPLDKPKTECLCKKYDLIWGNKVSCEFRKKVVMLAAKLGLPEKDNEGANWLMAVMALETGRTFSPTCGTFQKHKDDTKEGYVGIIQIGKIASIDIDVLRSDIIKMTAEEQLDVAEKFLMRNKSKYKSKTDLYLAINYPNACGHGDEPNYVVYDSSNAAYDGNPMFKREPDEYWIDSKGKHYYKGQKGSSYVWEFEEAINDFYNEGKSNKADDFECQNIHPFDAKDIITYHIYSTGHLERHVPKEIKEEYKEKYKYVYHDKDNNAHPMGVFKFNTINNVYGPNYGGDKVDLIDISQLHNYESGSVKLKITLNTERFYVNDKTLGSIIGAMIECGNDDNTFNGGSHSDGSSHPSTSHKNGYNLDLRYLRKDKAIDRLNLASDSATQGWPMLDEERQNKFNDALFKFGWKQMLSWSYGEDDKLLNHTRKYDGHNDHLHLQDYSPKFKEMKE